MIFRPSFEPTPQKYNEKNVFVCVTPRHKTLTIVYALKKRR